MSNSPIAQARLPDYSITQFNCPISQLLNYSILNSRLSSSQEVVSIGDQIAAEPRDRGAPDEQPQAHSLQTRPLPPPGIAKQEPERDQRAERPETPRRDHTISPMGTVTSIHASEGSRCADCSAAISAKTPSAQKPGTDHPTIHQCRLRRLLASAGESVTSRTMRMIPPQP